MEEGRSGVERRLLEERVVRVRARVTESARIVDDQRQRIQDAYRDGLLLPESVALLVTFMGSHERFREECARLEALLAGDASKRLVSPASLESARWSARSA